MMNAFLKKCRLSVLMVIISAGVAYGGGLDRKLAETISAGDIAQLKVLLDQGADINARNKEGETLLMLAALEGRAEIVRFLIDRGADVKARDGFGATALLYAAMGGSLDTMKVLIDRGADPDVKTDDGQTALSVSIMRGNDAAVRFLEQVKAKK